MKKQDGMGCEKCYGEDAKRAWTQDKEQRAVLLDDSHFAITIEACPDCRQLFVRIFTEFVDWAEGNDPQYWDLLPVTEEEAAVLRAKGDQLDLQYLMDLGKNRRHLKADDRGVRWASGGLIIMPGG